MYELNPEEIDLGSSLRKVRAFQGSSYPESTNLRSGVFFFLFFFLLLWLEREKKITPDTFI